MLDDRGLLCQIGSCALRPTSGTEKLAILEKKKREREKKESSFNYLTV